MLYVKRPTRRHFTDAARAAAKEARRRKKEEKVARDLPEVFIVRRPENQRLFGWEIRLFGGIVVERSPDEFSTIPSARAAGLQALTQASPKA